MPAAAPWTSGARRVFEGLGLALLCGACQTFDPPDPGWSARYAEPDPVPEALAWTRSGLLDADSEALSGLFVVALAVERIPETRIRLQLFPEIGGKVLDLEVSSHALHALLPYTAEELTLDLQDDAPLPRHLAVLMGITLLEAHQPLGAARILGQRKNPGGFELLLEPRLAGVRVVALVDPDGRLLGRDYAFRGVRWTERLTDQGTEVEARRVRIHITLDPPVVR